MRWLLTSLIVLGFLCMTDMSAQYFTDFTDSSGLDSFQCNCDFGRGVSFVDFNDDDWPDLTFGSTSGDSLYFFENIGGTFERVYLPIGDTADVISAYWADLDNDGDQDLVTATFGPNHIYRCDGPSQYTDVTDSSGILNVSDLTWGINIADINNDGLLDIIASNYNETTHRNYLYINEGNLTFSEKSVEYNMVNWYALSFNSVAVDFDRDGYQDLYFMNDRYSYENKMYRNINGSTLADSTSSSNTGLAINAMNTGIADYNEDGWMDIYVSNSPEGNHLLKNNGDFTFTDETTSAGVGFYRISWGGSFFDVDNDRDMDLYVNCMNGSSTDPNALYINQGPPNFTYNEENIQADTASAFANTVGDFNRDGKMDLVSYSNDGFEPKVYKNVTVNQDHWVKVKLKGVSSNRDGIGTQFEMRHQGRTTSEYANAAQAYIAQHSEIHHFGIGMETTADSLLVYWPSGTRDTLTDLPTDTCLLIVENSTNLDSIELSGKVEKISGGIMDSMPLPVTGDFERTLFPNDTGYCVMTAPQHISLNITPSKNEDWTNGLSTVDLVEIQAHILGINDLDSPYEHIAADANADGIISTLDLIYLQGLILGLYSEIENNTSYRFVPSSYNFNNPNNPLQEDFPESIEIINGTSDVPIDFEAIKIGDVNF